MKASWGLIGTPIKHSLSPMIHAKLHDRPYHLYETLDLNKTLEIPHLMALNVTTPLKNKAFEIAQSKDPWAHKTHAVNTLVKKEDGWHGSNTDASALFSLFSRWFKKTTRPVHILGNGATAHTIIEVLKALGFSHITVHARRPKAGEKTWEDLKAAAGILINATPLGLKETKHEYPFDLSVVRQFEAVFDVLYTPYRTPLIQEAQRNNIPWHSGLSMLVTQAQLAVELAHLKPFTGSVQAVFESVLDARLNIVLIGMPQAGKTTWGKALANHLKRPFYDLDEWITQTSEMTPQTWIETRGEAAFRMAEKKALHTLIDVRGAVIATGGGTILDTDNVSQLKAHGVLVYLNADAPETLSASRPLSSDIEAYQTLLKARTPIYQRVCDYEIQRHTDMKTMLQEWEERHATFLRHQWT